MDLLLLFIILSIVNVIMQTFKSIVTIHGGRMSASLTNAIAYGFYTIVVVYIVCDLPLWQKALVTAICNFFGVYFVKLIEEKFKKDKLWKIEATVKSENLLDLLALTNESNVSYNFTPISEQEYSFNYYCYDKESSNKVIAILKQYNCKWLILETKMI